MLGTGFHRFLRDESGGYTIWSLIWFSLYVAMGGLAVDVTDAYRNQTMLQSTADAAALAGVMSLPNEADVKAQALFYASNNMPPSFNGFVLKDSDVIIGNWNFDTRKFSAGGGSLNAVLVTTQRTDENQNPLATNFLRILGLWGLPLESWNIRTEAYAASGVADCRRGGFVAGNKMDVTSGNYFFNDICIHGQNLVEDSGPDWAIDLNNDNTYQRAEYCEGALGACGVQVSYPYESMLNDRPNVYDKNDGLWNSVVQGDVWPTDAMYGGVLEIIKGLIVPSSPHFRGYITEFNEDGTPAIEWINENYSGINDGVVDERYAPGTIYIAKCNSSKPLSLPANVTIYDVVIIADCPINASNGLILENVVIASTVLGNASKTELDKQAINLASAARLGAVGFCDSADPVNDIPPTGGVELYALASAKVAASLSMNGLRAVVGGNFEIAAQGTALGVSVQAGNNITFTAAGNKNGDIAGGSFGLCPQGTLPPGEFALNYYLVQ